MAIWGAPDPVLNGQMKACQCAMEFAAALEILNMGLPKFMPRVEPFFFYLVNSFRLIVVWEFIMVKFLLETLAMNNE